MALSVTRSMAPTSLAIAAHKLVTAKGKGAKDQLITKVTSQSPRGVFSLTASERETKHQNFHGQTEDDVLNDLERNLVTEVYTGNDFF